MDTPPPRSRFRAVPLALAAALLAALVYANALGNGFALDDETIVARHPVLNGGGGVGEVLLAPWWPQPPAMYRPVTLLSFALDRALWGTQPAMFHLTNVLLHAAATGLLVLLLFRLGARPAAAALGGAAFAVHPVHVEAVSNVVGRAEVLAALLVFCAALLHLSRRMPPWARACGVGVLYLLALGAKEIALALPALLLLLDALREAPGRVSLRGMARESWMTAVATGVALAAFLLLRRSVIGSAVGAAPAPYLADLSTTERWAAAVGTWPEYLRLLLFPARLSAEWGPDLLPVSGWGDARAWLGLVLGMAVLAGAAAAWNRDRWVSVAILWFAFAVFPISNLPFGAGALVTERSLYLPSAAVAFLAPPLVALAMRAREDARRLAALAAVLVLALGAARTWTRTPTWESTDTVFVAMAEESPELWFVEWRLAKLLSAAGRTDESLEWYAKAQPKVRHNHTAMSVEQAGILVGLGRVDEAERLLVPRLKKSGDVPAVHVLLSRVRFDQGRYPEALASARTALGLVRHDAGWRAEARHMEALSLDALGRRDEALAAAREAARSPIPRVRRPARWVHYAYLLRLAGDASGAEAALDSARSAAPGRLDRLRVEAIPGPTHPLARGWVRERGRPVEEPEGAAVAPAARGL
jgi:protein O-mannosyl-transferase